MADIILSPLIDAVIGNLVSVATDEIKMLWGVKEEVDRLHSTLSAIGAVLEDAEEKQVTSHAVNNWLRKLKNAAYDVEDIVDDFATEALRGKLERSIPEIRKRKQVSRFFSCLLFKKVVVMHEIGFKIKEVRQRLDDIAKERSHFHLKSSDGGRPFQPIDRPKSGSLVDVSEVFGRDYEKQELIKTLMRDDDKGRNVSFLPIVGMAGSGKTTLAQLLYDDTLIRNQFEIRAWVCVSDSFDVARITKEIIESATKAQCESLVIEPLQNKLVDILRGKKFIIVLDDVWNENKIQEWKNLCLPLKDGARGSKIIVTTRSDKVAAIVGTVSAIMGTVSAHKLGVLSEDGSWRLFEKMAFGGESWKAPQTLVNIGKQILRKCGGLPLAIKTMGALLSSIREESKWNNILLSKIWELPEGANDILPSLRLSYQHLPTNLKQCFTYCSLFPKDYNFQRDELVKLWIGEGFVKPRAGMEMEMEEVGLDLFEDLLSRSFFQSSLFGDEYFNMRNHQKKKKYFNMHDIVHDMAEFFSKEECVKIEGGMSFDILKNARRTSIINQEGVNLIKLHDWNKFYNLRTFLNVTYYKLVEHSDGTLDLLLRCKRLHVLSLPWFSIHELPNSIGNCKHLRYLDLSFNDFRTLPESIGDLYNLHTLNLLSCGGLVELPESIRGLYSLQTLNLSQCRSFYKLPESIGGLYNLKTLNLLRCRFLKEVPESIGGLCNLHTLNLSYYESLNELPESIGGLYNLQTLNLSQCRSFNKLPESIGGLYNLKTLNLLQCRFLKEVPESIGGLKNLQTLNLSQCGSFKKLPESIGGLYNLQTLNLLQCESLNELPESIGGLYNLQTLNLSQCKFLKELPESTSGLYNLQTLNLSQCESLKELPKDVTNLIYLRHLQVGRTMQLPFGIGKMSQLVTLPYFKVGIRENEPKLGELKDLVHLRGAIEISGLNYVNNKEEAEEANLKNKKYLQKVTLKWGWKGNSSLNDEEVLEALQPPVTITELKIVGYRGDKLTPSWFSKFDRMITFVNLVEVEFRRCRKCKTLPPLGQLPSLKKLKLWLLEEMRILGDEFCGDNGTFPSLEELLLFKLNSLEKWSGGKEGGGEYMPCLRKLKIALCDKLKQLPEKGLSTSLQHLVIIRCPKLKERLEKETGEDWPKISHIPHLTIL